MVCSSIVRNVSLAAAGLALIATGAVANPGVTPFGALDGSWTGTGQVRLESGQSENLKCKGYYKAKDAGTGLGLSILCASANSRIELRATLVASGGRVSGTWEERTFNAAGDVTGQVSDSRITLAIAGGGIAGTMAVTFTGSNQRVAITTSGTGLKGVTINLGR